MTTLTVLKPFDARALLNLLRGISLVAPWLVYLFASDIALSLLLPLSFVAPSAAYHLSSRIAYLVWRWIQVIFTNFNGARISVSGSTVPENESALVVANHVSWTDFYMIQHLAIKAGMLGRCRWFAKQQLKWVPFLGWGLWAMGMPLISRRWDKDQKELDRVFKGPKQYRWPICESEQRGDGQKRTYTLTYGVGLISYSEATRFTAQKYLETVQWCKGNNRPIPRYTLYPRTKGFVTMVKELAGTGSVTAIYDLTIAYAHQGRFMEAPGFWESLSESHFDQDWRFHVHVDRFEIAELIGKSDSELAKWLETRWMAKSKRLEQLQSDLENGRDWAPNAKTNGVNGVNGKKHM